MKIPENHQIHETEQLLSSLMEAMPHIQTFKGKWSVIRNKLSDLPTQFKVLSEFPNFSTSPLASELVQSVSQTLSDALPLARKCTDSVLIEGKLRTQNDIDSVSAKLDQHIQDLKILIQTGVLQDSSAVDSTSSKRETVRVEARNLITRLQIGNPESKNSAIDSLLGLLYDDDKNVLIVVAQGVVPVLVRLLESSCLEIKEKAISAISRVSTVDNCRHLVISEGIFLINHLLRILESRSEFAKEKACIALQALSFSKENARAIGGRSGISSLLEICQFGTPNSLAYAAGVLRNLAEFKEIRKNFVEENAIPVLIGVVNSGTFAAQENAIGCLCNLVCDDDDSLKNWVYREGGIESLKSFWDAAQSIQSLEVAIGLLRNLASCKSISIGQALVSDGLVAKLMGVLNCGVLGLRMAAAEAVYELGFRSKKARREMGEAGFVAQLVKMLEAKASEEKEMAAKALFCLLLSSRNRMIFSRDEKAVECTVQLLDSSVHNLDRNHLISVLTSIANVKKCRKRMVSAGACAYLQKLVEMEIDGAKKLHEKLDHNKAWGFFARTK